MTLTGRVTMPFKRNDIAARVAKIDGVSDLVNGIEVLPVSIEDSRLRMRVAQAIYGNSSFWHYASMVNPPIHIVVERSRVTLTGCVNSEVERMLAYALAQVDGSLSVANELRVDKIRTLKKGSKAQGLKGPSAPRKCRHRLSGLSASEPVSLFASPPPVRK